jgi:photosystem II stability/assembly factor-like uncharacterized protein
MKRLIKLSFLLYCFSQFAYSQITDWFWLNPIPQGNTLNRVASFSNGGLIAVGDNGTFIKSMDNGKHWTVDYNFFGIHNSLLAIYSFENYGIIIGENKELFRSSDGGDNWIKENVAWNLIPTNLIFINADTILARGSQNSVLRSINGGLTWSMQGNIPGSESRGFSYSSSNGRLYAGGKSKFYYSTDYGISWDSVSITGQYANFMTVSSISFCVNFGIAVMEQFYGCRCIPVYRTTDGGLSWEITNSFDYQVNFYGVRIIDPLNAIGIMSSSTSSHTEFVSTRNQGATWTTIAQDDCRYIDVTYSQNREPVAVGYGGAIMYMENGRGNYLGTNTFPIEKISFHDDYNAVAAGGFGDVPFRMWVPSNKILSTTDGGITWTGRAFSGRYTPFNDIYLTKESNAIVAASDGIFRIPSPNYSELIKIVDGPFNALSFKDSVFGIAVGDSGKISLSTNSGTSWVLLPGSITNLRLNGIAFSRDTIAIIVGSEGTILRSKDGGNVWSQITCAYKTSLNAVVFDELSNEFLAVGDSGMILRSTNKGQNWNIILSNLNQNLNAISTTTFGLGVIVGDSGTILLSKDAGQTWGKQLVHTQNDLYSVSIVKNDAILKLVKTFRIIVDKKIESNLISSIQSSSLTVYVTGDRGLVMVAGISPLHGRTWNGSVDSSWFTSENWTPTGVPLPGDSIVIPPFVPNDPVINRAQKQITIASLNILQGGKLTITDSLSRFIVMADVLVKGKLEVRPPANTTIFVGGSWIVKSDSISGFLSAKSTVYMEGSGTVEDNFYNIVFDTASHITSARNIGVNKQCTVLKDFNLRGTDTLYINDSIPQALIGTGKIPEGTVSRAIKSGSTEPYRFESEGTYVQFEGNEVAYPAAVNVTTYPKTDPATYGNSWQPVGGIVDTSIKRMTIMKVRSKGKWAIGVPKLDENKRSIQAIDSSFVQRIYSIDEIGETDALVTLSLRYESSEVPSTLPQSALQLFWMPNLPEVVKLAYPNDDGVMGRKSLEFRWHKPKERVSEYRFELCIDSLFVWNVADTILTDTTVVIDSVEGLKQYWWRVRARNEYGWSEGRNVRKLQVTLMGVDEKENIPKEYSISQNYPNPFNPVTTIKYQLPKESYVTLKIYNTLGQVITTLVDATQSAGYKSVEWNASRFTSGVYFYELEAIDIAKPDNIFNQVRKMIILK